LPASGELGLGHCIRVPKQKWCPAVLRAHARHGGGPLALRAPDETLPVVRQRLPMHAEHFFGAFEPISAVVRSCRGGRRAAPTGSSSRGGQSFGVVQEVMSPVAYR